MNTTPASKHRVTRIAGGGEPGVLHGAFRDLRHIQTHGTPRQLAILA